MSGERVPQDACEFGVYEVRACIGGRWQSIRMDDYMPCTPGGGPVFARNNGNELWVMLLEKVRARARVCVCVCV